MPFSFLVSVLVPAADEALERDMFSLIWGPTLAAVSVILDNSTESSVIHRALDALLLAARMAAYHQVGQTHPFDRFKACARWDCLSGQ